MLSPLHFQPRQASLLFSEPTAPIVALTDEVTALLSQDAVVAVGVSGGRDSQAVALAIADHLDAIGHTGPRVLIHADLGRVEWQDSLPSCERLAAHLGWELMVVRRQAGDMMARWEGRWENNLARYRDLSCVKLILPWSTPSMRFCTSELKSAIIARALRKRFPDAPILNATGIRRQESSARSKMPVSAVIPGLVRKNATGVSWNAVIDWTMDDVHHRIAQAGLALHEAYTQYAMSRVSCCFCIMSSAADLKASATCVDNQEVYRLMVDLEARSSFAFQSGKWLGDVAPHLLSDDLKARLARGRTAAAVRQAAEDRLPKHLLYAKGWPTGLPTIAEAQLIADVRKTVAATLDIEVDYTTAESIRARFAELLTAKAEKFGIHADLSEAQAQDSEMEAYA